MFDRKNAPCFVTLKCGGQPITESPGRTTLHVGSEADLPFARKCVDQFSNELLRRLYGRHWHVQQPTIWYSFLAIPETLARDGLEKTHLHYHCLLDGASLETRDEDELRAVTEAAWKRVSLRNFLHNRGSHFERAGDDDAVLAYCQKHFDDNSRHSENVVLKRDKNPLPDSRRLSGIHGPLAPILSSR